ncbi:prolyl aminopeptidase (secreted protein) [Colletotrichum scovillei]|nr:prolyl aminopeptidase (secreted protein) [Colletotrichum scovillei]
MMLLIPFTLIFGQVVLQALAADIGQASSFNITPEVAQRYNCSETCQEAIQTGNEGDIGIFGTNFDFDFYETAANFTGSKPGDILKIQPVIPTNITVPAGVAVYKIQYTSADIDGSPMPVTGFVAFPFARTQQPFNLIAYAHGTSGVFRGCAPSTSPSLFDYQSWSPLLIAGYAVVATDYAGLGNNYTAHKYVASAANANDTYWSVVAARTAFPDILSHDWASIGHSQGGGAVWKLSEHKLVQDSASGYLGGVAVAPVTKIYDALVAIDSLRNVTQTGGDDHDFLALGVIPSAVLGIKATFPDYDAPAISAKLKNRIDLAKVGQLCDNAISGLTVDLRLDALSNRTAASDTRLKEFQELNAPAQGDRASKPLLLVLGEDDTIVSEESGAASFEETCAYGNPVHMSIYPGLDHSAVLTAATPEWLAFFQDRFAGKALGEGCSNETKIPFDLEHAQRPLDSY